MALSEAASRTRAFAISCGSCKALRGLSWELLDAVFSAMVFGGLGRMKSMLHFLELLSHGKGLFGQQMYQRAHDSGWRL